MTDAKVKNKETQNKGTMTRWYNEMWGKCNTILIPELVSKTTYLRHDVTGANNAVTAQQYAAMTSQGMGDAEITDFSHFTIAEGDYLATLGRYLFSGKFQWDWVQLFRLEDARLTETWLPGMGCSEVYAQPTAENAWTENTIPAQPEGTASPTKDLINSWYEGLAKGNDVTDTLSVSVRCHDLLDADITLTSAELQQRMRDLMGGDQAGDLELFVIEENDLAVAAGMWQLGSEGNQRSWNWVQAFRIENGRIAETWLPCIGGTDSSLKHSTGILWDLDVMPEGSTRMGTQV